MEMTEQLGGISFLVRVTPRASQNAIEGEFQGALRVRLTAPPIDDRANDALRKFLAAHLKVPASSVQIIAGEKSRSKRVLVKGITRAQAQQLFGPINA
jgi:uncharacterized protein (TIGR00251 family)